MIEIIYKNVGNVGCGKEALCKALANDLGAKYFPDVTPELDYRYDEDGFDHRDLNKYLHEGKLKTKKKF